MNLITTCPSCLSQYSVSPETLRIADGWVGCGQCGYVYDATKTLKNVPVLHQDIAPAQTPVASAPEALPQAPALPIAEEVDSLRVDPPVQPVVAQAASEEPAAPGPELVAEPEPVPEPEPEHLAAPQASAPESSNEPAPVSSQILSVKLREALVEESPEPVTKVLGLQQLDATAAQHDEPLLRLDAEPEPEAPRLEDEKRAAQLRSMRHAIPPMPAVEEQSRTDPWRDFDAEPPVRKKKANVDPLAGVNKKDNSLLQSILLSVLLVALVFQFILYYRDFLSSTIPAMRAPLQQACVFLKCKVHSWRNIDAVVIQHASLTQNDAGYYKMNLAVKNTAAQKVAMPSVQLSLLDANGTIMLRRVLSPEDLRAPEVLQTGRVWEGEWMIQIAVPLPLSNYKIQVLYP